MKSSIRYKEHVEDMGSFSENVLKLRPVIFHYKEDNDKTLSYGLIAEEVERIFPDLVSYNPQGQPEAVMYQMLSSILLNEVKKLCKRVDELESKNNPATKSKN